MTDHKLKALVAEAVSLDRQIRDHTDRLKELKHTIATEADTRADEATPTEGGGSSITFEGNDGCIARVTTAGPTLKSAIKGEGKDIVKIREAAGRVFERLFSPVWSWKPVDNFRDEAATLLGRDSAKLIKLCEVPGKTTVSFETTDR